MKEPQVTVGIMSERQIRFVFNGTYLANGVPVSGEHEAHTDGKQIPESFSLPKKKTIRFVSKR